jgi:hypothetical protein
MAGLFENAVERKYRFPYRGQLSIEDLYDLDMGQLDEIYKRLNSQLKLVTEDSLMETVTAEDRILYDKIGIVKYIFNKKSEEKQARILAKEKREQKQELLAILKMKQVEDLKGKSAEDLQKMIEEL